MTSSSSSSHTYFKEDRSSLTWQAALALLGASTNLQNFIRNLSKVMIVYDDKLINELILKGSRSIFLKGNPNLVEGIHSLQTPLTECIPRTLTRPEILKLAKNKQYKFLVWMNDRCTVTSTDILYLLSQGESVFEWIDESRYSYFCDKFITLMGDANDDTLVTYKSVKDIWDYYAVPKNYKKKFIGGLIFFLNRKTSNIEVLKEWVSFIKTLNYIFADDIIPLLEKKMVSSSLFYLLAENGMIFDPDDKKILQKCMNIIRSSDIQYDHYIPNIFYGTLLSLEHVLDYPSDYFVYILLQSAPFEFSRVSWMREFKSYMDKYLTKDPNFKIMNSLYFCPPSKKTWFNECIDYIIKFGKKMDHCKWLEDARRLDIWKD